MKCRTGLFIADLHTGSLFGLWPERYEIPATCGSDLQLVALTKNQDDLFDLWVEMTRTVRPDFVVVNGDACEGWNPKEKARYLMTADLTSQVSAATKLLKMIKGEPEFILTEGTSYHVADNPVLDELVAKELGAEYGVDKAIELKEGTRIHVCHSLGYSNIPAYRTTAIARELMVATINADILGRYDLLIRSHVHYHVQVEYAHTVGHVLPCWKVRDPYAAKKGLAMNPKIGWIVYRFYEDGVFECDKRRSRIVDVKGQVGRVKI